MHRQVLILVVLLLGLPLLGCSKPTTGKLSDSESDKTVSDDEINREANPQAKEKNRDIEKGGEKVDAERIANLLESFRKKYGFQWSDDRESDVPLVIEHQLPPVPAEIQGPFPENAEWRTKPGEKSRRFWFWK